MINPRNTTISHVGLTAFLRAAAAGGAHHPTESLCMIGTERWAQAHYDADGLNRICDWARYEVCASADREERQRPEYFWEIKWKDQPFPVPAVMELLYWSSNNTLVSLLEACGADSEVLVVRREESLRIADIATAAPFDIRLSAAMEHTSSAWRW